MSLLLLLSLFVVSALLWARLPERTLGVLTVTLALALAVTFALLGDVARAQSALVVSTILGGAAVVTSAGVRWRARASRPVRTPRPTPAPPTPSATPTGELAFTDYEVMDRIGIGGMGNVYRARRRADGRIVALKVPQEKYLADAKFVKRFYREAEVLRRLAHPNIVKVFDYKAEPGEHYIAMEFLDGHSLEQLLEEANALTFEQSVQVVRAVSDALRHIHAQNIVHRDIKPGNIMILRNAFRSGKLRDGYVKLMDFGIAVGKVLTRLTMTGARVGTPIYMAPEQAKGNKVDSRSDVYSLGLVFYEMVTGETPFKGSYEAVVHQQVFEQARPPKQVRMDVPGKLNDLILRMIEKDPAARPTLDEVIAAIDEGVLEDDAFDDPVALAVSVGERQGTLRYLDVTGRIRQSVRDLNGEDGLPAAPTALAADGQGGMYAVVVTYKVGGDTQHMIQQFDALGREIISFGRYGLSEGELLQPVSLSVSGDRVYVLDTETCLVSVFTTGGEYLFRFGGRGAGRGTFDRPVTLVAAPNGELLVLDVGNREIQRFTRDGKYLSRVAFKRDKQSEDLRLLDGLGVDATGAVYVGDAQASKIRRVEPSGKTGTTYMIEPLHGEMTENPWIISIDAGGMVYCVRQGGQQLRKFSPEGKLLATIDTYTPVLAFTLLERERVLA